jgi:Uri superfamily endonuclease
MVPEVAVKQAFGVYKGVYIYIISCFNKNLQMLWQKESAASYKKSHWCVAGHGSIRSRCGNAVTITIKNLE